MITLQSEPFDPGEMLNTFTANLTGAGAVVSFTGIVRDVAGGLEHMEIEHYPAMTAKALATIRDEALRRWSLSDALILHRYGVLRASDMIMMVITAAPHRQDAFQAADFLMDYLKSRAPFWKKEVSDASASWVDAQDSDERALDRWS